MKIDINNKEISTVHSLRCFLNSLLREYKNFEIAVDEEKLTLVFDDCAVDVALLYNSSIGRFSFKNEIIYKPVSGESRQISFEEFVSLTLEKLSSLYTTTPEALGHFQVRIHDSQRNIESHLHNQTEFLNELFSGSECSFGKVEQSLFLGHNFHPHPKNRDGFSSEDALLYAPESRGEFALEWLLVKEDVINITSARMFHDRDWVIELFLKDHGNLVKGYYPIPIHPWQIKNLMNHPEIISYLAKKIILRVPKSKDFSLWSATSSLRSVYNKDSDYMLKFSMSVRLTNSLRHLLPHEVIRGIQVYDVFKTKKMESFKKSYPQFNVIFEPAFMAIQDSQGRMINESIVSLRENVFKAGNDKNKYVLAALLQDHPVDEISLLGSLIKKRALKTKESLEVIGKKWAELFIDYAVVPLLAAQSKYGVMLGAHQQNLIIELVDSLPNQAYFRDCQGTGYSELGFKNFAAEVESLALDNGNILDNESGSALFSYYLFINSVFNVMATLAKDTEVPEREYFKILKNKLIEFKKTDILDHSCIDYLLESDYLLQKGNFLCSIIDLNENTTNNPLGIYNKMINPLKDI